MKRAAMAVVLTVLAACDSGKPAEPAQREPGKQSSGSPSAPQPNPQPDSSNPDAGYDPTARPGEPGHLVGHLRSPYVRLGTGVVYIEEVRGRTFERPAKNPVMDQKNKIFTPHVLPVLVGSTVDFPNHDDVRHSVYARKDSAVDFSLGKYDAGVVKRVKFDKLGVTHLGCNVHAEMSAYILSLQNAHYSLTDSAGAFRIENVPPGAFKLTFFHEQIHPKTLKITVAPGQRVEVDFTGLRRK